jgi:hypothetical protein
MTLRFKHAASAFFLAIVLVLIIFGAERITGFWGAPEDKLPVSKLVQELRALPTNGDDVVISRKSYDKVVIVGASEQLISRASWEDIVGFYSGKLPRYGWTLSYKSNDGRQVKYCKERMSLTIEPFEGGDKIKYNLAIVWVKFERSPAYCPSKI